ncbi:MAG: hypothetical protein J5674_02710 [Candidatus Methanomethylophilaceae archaeon]|nr:hypothetical protein [Candidatus Methanomethylophilaceae archaeon]
MFGYTVPAYQRLSPLDLAKYRRYYCEGCHQLRDGFGLLGTATVNFDMTFNTILLAGVTGEALEFEGTKRRICVLDSPKADSDLMRKMAAYTLILTKWELFDDETDKPSMKVKAISAALGKAMEKAVKEFPEYDDMVGKGFQDLRRLELDGCKDARRMGTTFGKGLTGALKDFAGDHACEDLDILFEELSAAVYIMDALDDLDDDYMDGTYNPFLPDEGYVNARSFVNANLYRLSETVSATVGSLQSRYSKVRPKMSGNVSLCDNIVYYGIPESAKRVLTGDTTAKASVKNVLSNRKERMSRGARGVEQTADVQLVGLAPGRGADASAVEGAVLAAPWPVPPACGIRGRGARLRDARPDVPLVTAQPARPAFAVALVRHGCT